MFFFEAFSYNSNKLLDLSYFKNVKRTWLCNEQVKPKRTELRLVTLNHF